MTFSTGSEVGPPAATAEGRPWSPIRVSLVFVGIALACLFVADLEVIALDPWHDMGRLFLGLLSPDLFATERLGEAVVHTVAFALLGVAMGSALGAGLAFVYHRRTVRLGCAFVRSIHELFWALIFLQMVGLSPLTGILAIGIPYGGICAKVYAEILEESDTAPLRSLPPAAGHFSAFLFARLPDAWVHIKTYTLYRLECGLRSSAVLGFVGLPTLGFHLESAFRQGNYGEVWGLLILFYLIIATIRIWARPRLLPILVLGAPLVLPAGAALSFTNVARFLTEDIVPHPLRAADGLDATALAELGSWAWALVGEEALPGIFNTVVLTQIALVATGVLTLLLSPLVSRKFFGPGGRTAGHLFLVVARSTPEYILAYILLQFWGPSMLPAVVALALHNGAIIGHLIGRQTDSLPLRLDSSKGVNLYAYEVLPRLYGQFLAFLFYRWEVIMRETAVLGILGVHTLGFFVDSAIAELRLDRAFFLIVITALLNIGIDVMSRGIREGLRVTKTPAVR